MVQNVYLVVGPHGEYEMVMLGRSIILTTLEVKKIFITKAHMYEDKGFGRI